MVSCCCYFVVHYIFEKATSNLFFREVKQPILKNDTTFSHLVVDEFSE